MVPLLVAFICVVGMSQGFLDANFDAGGVLPCRKSGTAATGYGLMNFVGTTAGGIMTFVGGRLKDANVPFTVTFQYAAGFILVAGLLLLRGEAVFFKVVGTRRVPSAQEVQLRRHNATPSNGTPECAYYFESTACSAEIRETNVRHTVAESR